MKTDTQKPPRMRSYKLFSGLSQAGDQIIYGSSSLITLDLFQMPLGS
jgi:hypothetical protein